MYSPDAPATSRPKNLVQAIERAAVILDILGQFPKGLSVGEIAGRINLPKGTVHRLLSSLAYFDYVRQETTTRHYQLGFKLVELGNCLLSQIDLRDDARPFLIALAEAVQETVHLVVRDNQKALYIDKVHLNPVRVGLQMVSRLGGHIPLHCSSVGKVLLADMPDEQSDAIIRMSELTRRTPNTIVDPDKLRKHLRKVHEQGFAIDDEENETGIRCVAAPIRNETGRVEAAISISGPATRITKSSIDKRLKARVCETALEISRKIGYRQ